MNGKRTTTPSALKLNSVVQHTPKGDTNRTGFPEPLSPDRNTTLRHPSADTSPGACIEASDVPLSRTHSRVSSRHSFGFGYRQKSSRADTPIDMNAYSPDGGRTSNESIDEILEAVVSVETNPNGEVITHETNEVAKTIPFDQGRTSSEASFEKSEKDTTKKRTSLLRKLHLGTS